MLQPGSLVRWIYRVKLPENATSERAATALADDARSTLPEAGWEIRTRDKASPQLERNVRRFTEFLTLVGLTALLVGGVGVANAVKYYLDRKGRTIATLKALGFGPGYVAGLIFGESLAIACVGCAIGIAATFPAGAWFAKQMGTLFPVFEVSAETIGRRP